MKILQNQALVLNTGTRQQQGKTPIASQFVQHVEDFLNQKLCQRNLTLEEVLLFLHEQKITDKIWQSYPDKLNNLSIRYSDDKKEEHYLLAAKHYVAA